MHTSHKVCARNFEEEHTIKMTLGLSDQNILFKTNLKDDNGTGDIAVPTKICHEDYTGLVARNFPPKHTIMTTLRLVT